MDHSYHGRPPTRRRAPLGDATLRANQDTNSHRRRGEKPSPEILSSSPKYLPHNESLNPNGTLSVSHEPESSPDNKRISAVINEELPPRNPKRDSEISNASTNASNTGRRRKTHIGPWQLGKTIGRGGCSRVRLVRHSVNGEYGAAKIISKANAEKVSALSLYNLIESAEQDTTLGGMAIPFGLEREICIMKLLDHPNIVRLHDVWESHNELYLIMEYIEGGELFSYIGEYVALPEIEVVHLFRQVIAALLYCHRLNIHHRDLKPENILLDKETMTIKLVDFGMAAMQPTGKKLTTPCGSPHYAAPEVIRTKSYDGALADTWSCGVILYVMLAGTPPFNYNGDEKNLRYLFSAIAAADYEMPDQLSKEAKDLIKKILVPDPKKRITMEAIWEHPFLHKYDKELDFQGKKATIQHWVGPSPTIVGWQPLDRKTVDREILRYLRTLWHSEKEDVIVRRLISKESNQEKYFYSALQNYRNDELENYGGHHLAYSNSDYHHNAKTPPTGRGRLQLPDYRHNRSQSGYSILNNEHLYSRHSFYEPPLSDASYDPFRASREPIVPNQAVHPNVTIHRGSSSASRKLRPVTALGHRTGSSLRIQALTNSKNHSSIMSRNSSKRSTPSQRSHQSQQSQRSLTAKGRSISRSSMTSSHWPSSPPVIVRPGSIGKRGVSFSHLRRASITSASTAEAKGVHYTPEQQKFLDRSGGSVASSTRSRPPPSMQSSSPVIRAVGKSAANPIVPRLRVRKPESPSKYIQTEARKVSTELEKVMEEAFNRSSMSSSIRTIATDPNKDVSEYDTPPTSFSNRDSGGSTLATPNTKAMLQNRPLPPIPNETPNTFLLRKLAETRAEIARRLHENGDNTEHFNEVLLHLDRLMVPSATGAKRTSSAPAKSPEQSAFLPVISEEVKADDEDRYFEPYSSHYSNSHYRAVTDPIRTNLQGHRAVTDHTTIRLVSGSPNLIAPLNIRKRSGASTLSRGADDKPTVPWPGPVSNAPVRSYQTVQDNLLAVRTNENTILNSLPSVEPEKKESTLKKKKSSWFRRTAEEKDREQENQHKTAVGRLQIPEAWQSLDDRIKNDPPVSAGPSLNTTSNSSEFPIRNSSSAAGKNEVTGVRKGLFGLFGKKSKEDKGKRTMEFGLDNFSSSSILSGFDLGPENDYSTRSGPPELQTNWISRFLHIKPANKVLCFQIGRGKVRQEIVRLLRDWQSFGVKEVTFDRKTNTINARVDKNNRLKVKPVSIVIELFVVLAHGRRANLCLARFTQTRGAASSFRKAVDIIEEIFQEKNMLVEEEEKKAAMCEVLG
ncbi:serine/threonine-protein kinase-like protein GIN4 [Melanomma pulvis-pyrius CBS 109.77]|uniref:non-specific serine/threonine protein kinase n=1 Tax=Melanomma pulvis-pyrius CBS 109.77 TaxID=1314802 RepID=A0A6A6XMS0_9PLEO|nr:serine/threonine-protein kinase-like protein GIN4 [Melanomma pulvis-pyrius CBS 109.77]